MLLFFSSFVPIEMWTTIANGIKKTNNKVAHAAQQTKPYDTFSWLKAMANKSWQKNKIYIYRELQCDSNKESTNASTHKYFSDGVYGENVRIVVTWRPYVPYFE